jgi:hypothetical protein
VGAWGEVAFIYVILFLETDALMMHGVGFSVIVPLSYQESSSGGKR